MATFAGTCSVVSCVDQLWVWVFWRNCWCKMHHPDNCLHWKISHYLLGLFFACIDYQVRSCLPHRLEIWDVQSFTTTAPARVTRNPRRKTTTECSAYLQKPPRHRSKPRFTSFLSSIIQINTREARNHTTDSKRLVRPTMCWVITSKENSMTGSWWWMANYDLNTLTRIIRQSRLKSLANRFTTSMNGLRHIIQNNWIKTSKQERKRLKIELNWTSPKWE